MYITKKKRFTECATGGCTGDPHCYSFDGIELGYQGLQEHYLIKPITKYRNLPKFEVTEINTKWDALAVLEKVILMVPEWNKRVEISVPQTEKGRCIVTVSSIHEATSALTFMPNFMQFFLG